jgi:uncharacterized surface protein with fasciclin (FAS1) repeats
MNMRIFCIILLSMISILSCRRPGSSQEFENTGVSVFEEDEFGKQNIVSVTKAAGSFDKLILAIKTAGLKSEFMQEGPYTLFAPTDEAFEMLPGKSFYELLEPDHQHLLVELLRYHLVSGLFPADSLAEGLKITTQEGDVIAIDSSQWGWMINDAHLVKPDIKAQNGMVHIIDKVLMPPGN